MPCPTLPTVEAPPLPESNRRWTNWLGNVDYRIPRYYAPDSLADIVWVLEQEVGARVKAVGRGWSFEDIAVSRDVIVDISSLNRRITSLVDPGPGFSALTDAWQRRLRRGRSHLVHFEAGIRLFRLNQILDADGLAMPTLGGSQGQTLAGALSTSTHSSDVSQPPFPDLVKALHLVGEGGQEYWIEPASNPLTDDDAVLRAHSSPAPCADMQIVRDDNLFQAAVVSMGRFGIIYAVVLDVAEAFNLAEWTLHRNWSDISAELAAGVGRGPSAPPRSHFGALTALPAPPGDLRLSVGPTEFRYLEVILNSNIRSNHGNSDGCWVRRRWPTRAREPINLDPSGNPLCHTGVSSLLLATTATHLNVLAAAYAGSGIFAWKAPTVTAHAIRLVALSRDLSVPGGEALAEALNAIWDSQLFGELDWLVPSLNQMLLSEQLSSSSGDGIRGPSWQVMSGTTDRVEEDCFRANSVEIVFGLDTRAYIDFVDLLLDEAGRFQQAGYISIRFSRKSRALLSMHNVASPRAASIEVASLAGLADSQQWMEFVEERGLEMGGRPHWGQQNHLTRSQVERLYGLDTVRTWREQLLRVGDRTGGRTFSNAYTVQRGLEPVDLVRVITGQRSRDGAITHVCIEGAAGAPVPVEDVVRDILSERFDYVVSTPEGDNPVIVRRFLTTSPDGSASNNLDALPIARRFYSSPPHDLEERPITSVIKHDDRWETIRYVCNDDQEWMVPVQLAFHHINAGRYRYVVLDSVTGERTPVYTRQFLTTRPDSSEANNLGALPAC